MRAHDLTRLEKAALLGGATVWQTRALPRAGVRALWLADGPHGVRKQQGSADHLGLGASVPATCFPTAAALATTWDPDLLEEVGAALGREAAALGVDVLLGPGLNVKRMPLGGRNFEYFSEDPLLSGRLAAAMVRGVQEQGVAACPKHFAVNSQELRRMASDSVVDLRTLHEIYLTGFEIVVREARPLALMSAYNKVNGTYAHQHEYLVGRVLREVWGFDGVVVSDWGGADDPVAAVRAGGTLTMPAPGLDPVHRVLDAIARGELDEASLDARADEMLTLVQRLDAARARAADGPGAGTGTVDLDAHHALARRAAAAGTVLLRNEDALLPLARGTRVAVVGDLAFEPRVQGAGSSLVNPTRTVRAVDHLPSAGLQVVAAERGYRGDGTPDPALAAQAVAAVEAAHADVVLMVLGLPGTDETEGRDRPGASLPAAQVHLVESVAAVHPHVVVVLTAGGVVETPWATCCQALLHTHLPGQGGAEALGDVLTGAAEPTGRLAETFPVRVADHPCHGRFPAPGPAAEYREGPFVGYRYFTGAQVPVAFPFGFGLSYTTFALTDLVVDDTGVQFTVTNTGDRPGTHVPQLYVGAPAGSPWLRPVRELKGFARVHLAPGRRRTVRIGFDRYTFRHFDPLADDWRVEPGTWSVQVGAHVDDPALVGTVEVTTPADAPAHLRASAPGAPPAVPAVYPALELRDVTDADFAALTGRRPPGSPSDAGTVQGEVRAPLGPDDPVAAAAAAPGVWARVAVRLLETLMARAERRGHPDLNLIFMHQMPFRAMATMTGGRIGAEMVDALMLVVNGRTGRGLAALVGAWARHLVRSRRLRRALAQQGVPR